MRHYEQVSPAAKGQGDIVGDGESTIAATLGDAVTFNSRSPFGDELGSGVDGETVYIARRGSDGWTTHAVTPTPRPDAYQTFYLPTKVETFSDDLSKAIVWAYDLPGGGGEPDRASIYQEDTATRAVQALTVSQVDPLDPFDFLPANEILWGASADAQHVAFQTTTQMLPDAVPGARNVYQWDAGRGLSLAGILPDGTLAGNGSRFRTVNYRPTMSADGRRLLFMARPNSDFELYMRIDGSMTVPISTPNGFPDSTDVHLQAVTPDGRNVFFETDSPLVSGDTNGAPDLYRWTDSGDPAHDGTITQISTAGDFGIDDIRNGVVGVSDDGTRVYWQTLGGQLIVWDNGTTRLISADALEDSNPANSMAAVASQPGLGRVSPDGNWLAFVSARTLGNDGVHALARDLAGAPMPVTNGHYEMYVYSLRDDRLTCVSCPSGTATSDASVVPDVTAGSVQISDTAIRPRFLSDNGQVFFSTTEALVPEDVNGVEDVYEYDPSSRTPLRLVSTGTGRNPTSFGDASANGSDVFIETRQQLVAGDRDNLVDLYDATTRPPLPPAPQTAPATCQGDTCQPPSSGSPPDDQLGSLSFDGKGASASGGKLLAVPSRVAVRGSVASLRVRLLAGGTLTWRGGGVQSGSVKHGSGILTVRVRLDRRARMHLITKGRYVTRVRLTLVLKDGTRVSGIARVTFSATKKGR